MENQMFCFQCEQTARGRGCMGKAGVCGKVSEVANTQDELTKALIGLALAVEGEPAPAAVRCMKAGLFATITNVNFDNSAIRLLIQETEAETKRLGGKNIECGGTGCSLFLWTEQEDIRSLKSTILFGLRGMAAYAYHAAVLGYADSAVDQFFFEGLRTIARRDATAESLLPSLLKVGEVNLKCMELLDRANTETFGMPVPTTVPMMVEKGPFIIVTGHDLKDLQLLLEQTAGKGINVYTHGEMLPAHAYPKLKAYPHLKGNFGTAWQNQQKEFANIPGAVLYTTNCLMPPAASYADRIFTTEVVGYPGVAHIGTNKDFTPVIKKALELGGFDKDTSFCGLNGGASITTGFGHGTVLSLASAVVEAVQSGAVKHFFLVGGCDGSRMGRSYYTEFVKLAPKDSIILTLACGKYRFNDLDLGTINGIPRLLDMGQCNDAYSAIQVAVALARAFKCSINELPLSLVLSWYEQKAVCILLTLLHLGIKNILLGPSLPAFISPNILEFLVKEYKLALISTPEADLKKCLKK